MFYPIKVDDATGEQEITNIFADKFEKLYNCVSYDVNDINSLENDIKTAINNKCVCNNCMHGNHSINFKDCYDAIKKLEHSKSDGYSGILSDNIIHASEKLTC